MKNQSIVFAHSNGLGGKTYKYFLEQFAPIKTTFVDKFGTGEYSEIENWENLTVQLIKHIEDNHDKPVIGIGHSLGAAIMFFTAQQRPDLFSKIILMEPPIFSFSKRFIYNLFNKIGIADRFSPAGKALKRRDTFPSKTVAYKELRNKGIFRKFDENCFQDYIEYGFRDAENGVELDYPKALETKMFQNTPIKISKNKFSIPVHFLYSNRFKTLDEKDVKWWKSSFSNFNFHEIDGGHMFPLEKPEAIGIFLRSLF